MRHAPATYEEFLHTPKRELITMQDDFFGMEDFEIMADYFLRAKKEVYANQKLLTEGKDVENATIYEDIHYGEN